ncbi:AT-rich interactive domain-containing protein 5A, partial [Aptenodytes forsteri]
AGGCSSPAVPTPSPSGGCPSTCRTHTETYKRLFSSFYSKGNHPIMSPLAKKKRPEGWRSPGDAGPGPHLDEQRSPEPSGARDTAPSVGSEVGPVTSTSPGGRDSQPCPRAEEGGPVPTVFTGCFHAYRNEVLKPVSCHPLWGYFSSLKDFLEPPSTFQGKRGREEETAFGPGAKLRAISPFVKEADGRDTGAGSPGGQQGLAKPKAVVASPGYAAPLPQAPDVYKGAMLRFPASFGNPLEHLKTQGVPVAPSLSVNPFVVPAFPSPLVAASTQPSDLCRPLATGPGHSPASYESSLRHRLYPAATWHSQPTYASPHAPAFHRNAKL